MFAIVMDTIQTLIILDYSEGSLACAMWYCGLICVEVKVAISVCVGCNVQY